jgi:hypothetical protein
VLDDTVQKMPPVIGKADPPRRPAQKPRAELLFKTVNRVAHAASHSTIIEALKADWPPRATLKASSNCHQHGKET